MDNEQDSQVSPDTDPGLWAATVRARKARARQDWPEAVKGWSEALALHGEAVPPSVFTRLAEAHREMGDVAAAERVLIEAEARYPGNPNLAAAFAKTAGARGDWPEAVKRWETALALYGESAPRSVLARLAQAYRRTDEAAGAMLAGAVAKRAGDPNLARALVRVTGALRDGKGLETGLGEMLKAADAPEIYAAACRACCNVGLIEEGLGFVRRGLERYPRNVTLLAESVIASNFDRENEREAPTPAGPIDPHGVEIVVCVHNALTETLDCLNSLVASAAVPPRITIVDDGSEAAVASALDAFALRTPSVQVLRNDRNLGYTKSANRGLMAARSDWVVLLNSDTVVTAGWLEGLVECAASDPSIRAVGPVTSNGAFQSIPETREPGGPYVSNPLPAGWTAADVADVVRNVSSRSFPSVPLLTGFCMLLHRPTLEKVGFLDEENFPIGYAEEDDMCLRILTAGYRLAIADHVYVYHSGNASFDSARRAELLSAGHAAMERKWPEFSYRFTARGIERLPPLRALRNAVRAALSGAGDRQRYSA